MSMIECRRIGIEETRIHALLGVDGDITLRARRLWNALRQSDATLTPRDVAHAVRHVQPHCEAYHELLAQRIERIKPHRPRRRRRAATIGNSA